MKRTLRVRLAVCVTLAALLVAAVAPVQADTEAKAKVSNKEPQVTAIQLLTDDDETQGGAQVDPVAGGLKAIDIEVEAEDRNNHQDMDSAGCEVRRPDGTLHEEVQAAKRDGQGKVSTWDTSATLGSSDPPGTWRIVCYAKDKQMASENASPKAENTLEGVFEVRTLAAIQILETVVDFTSGGPMDPGTTTMPSSVTIENMGNVKVDLEVSGSDLVGSAATIAVGRVRYALADSMSGSGPLSTSGSTVSDFDLMPGEGSMRPLWFTLTIPSGEEQFIPAGTYAGTVTLGAVQDLG